MQELSPIYDSKKVEDKIYKMWEDSGYFNPDNLPARHKKPFTIIMPPPNANGSLHIEKWGQSPFSCAVLSSQSRNLLRKYEENGD